MYTFTGSVTFTSSGGPTIYLYINGVVKYKATMFLGTSAENGFAATAYLNYGDKATIVISNGFTLLNNTTDHWIAIVG